MVWCAVVWCGAVRCGVVWCAVVWCGAVRCGAVWCGMLCCGVVQCGVLCCAVVWCSVVCCGVLWCGCGVLWCAVVCCGVVWCLIIFCYRVANALYYFIRASNFVSLSDPHFRNPPSGLVADRVQGRNVIRLNPALRKDFAETLMNMSNSV